MIGRKNWNEFRSTAPKPQVLGKSQNWLMVAHQLVSAYELFFPLAAAQPWGGRTTHFLMSATPSAPDGVLLDSLKNLRERVCPLQCAAGEVVVNGRCVAAGCPRGEVLGRDGACYPLPAPRVTAAREAERPAVTRSTVLREERAAAPRKPKPAPREAVRASGGHCFSFNGSQYCE